MSDAARGRSLREMTRTYLVRSRSPWHSFLFVLPLLLCYHLGVLVTNFGQSGMVLNGADALLRAALRGLGLHGWFASAWLLALAAGLWIYSKDPNARRERLQPRTFAAMFAESVLYALLLGKGVVTIVQTLFPWIPPGLQIGVPLGLGQVLTVSLGAGLYEELVFRVLLMGGLWWLLRRLGGVRDTAAVVIAALVSSALFALFHYIGPMGDVFRLSSFTFRFVAGLVLAFLYRTRGFGITAATHALYDLFVVFGRWG
jgi:membrane protease YdiL (CAAX protease family)